MPEFREGHYILHMVAVPGTSLAESIRLGKLVTAELLKNPHIRSVSQEAGRAENGEDTFGPHYSELHVDLEPLVGEEAEKAEAEIRAGAGEVPGPVVHGHVIPGRAHGGNDLRHDRSSLCIDLFGNDLDVLDQKAREVRQVLASTPGAVDVTIEAQPGLPEMTVRLRPDRLLQYGFTPVDVLDAIQTAYQGDIVSQIYEGNRVFDVAVHPGRRRS